MIEETQTIKEKVIEIAKPILQERIVEVPEIEYVEKLVEVVERIIQEKIVEIPKVEIQERIRRIPRVVVQEKIIEIPEYEYREYAVEKIVEVPQIHEKIVNKEVRVPQYIDKPTPHEVAVHMQEDVFRKVPVPVEATSTFNFRMSKLSADYDVVEIPLYVPRFIEVPVPAEFMDDALVNQAHHFHDQIKAVAQSNAPSLGEVENLAGAIQSSDVKGMIKQDYSGMLNHSWASGRIPNGQLNPSSNLVSIGR
eukprot:Trichotokara_eunicae@DN6193_c0_g1_i1.p1